jgi:hypothetical protein
MEQEQATTNTAAAAPGRLNILTTARRLNLTARGLHILTTARRLNILAGTGEGPRRLDILTAPRGLDILAAARRLNILAGTG